jgi:hypothetical protein
VKKMQALRETGVINAGQLLRHAMGLLHTCQSTPKEIIMKKPFIALFGAIALGAALPVVAGPQRGEFAKIKQPTTTGRLQ